MSGHYPLKEKIIEKGIKGRRTKNKLYQRKLYKLSISDSYKKTNCKTWEIKKKT